MKYFYLVVLVAVVSCGEVKNNHSLPILGHHIYEENDTIYHTVGDFELVNQDSTIITNSDFDNHIYVADFFFTSCPTICPIMKTQMLRVYDEIKEDQDVSILSHTIDPEYDSVGLLKEYAFNLGVETPKWHFATGDKDSIYALAQTYLVLADEDANAPGGYVHSGAFLIVDKQRRIRGVYDGTKEEQVDLLIGDLDLLRKEYE